MVLDTPSPLIVGIPLLGFIFSTITTGLATDGASAMRGEQSGAAAKLRSLVNSDFKSFHCMAYKMEL